MLLMVCAHCARMRRKVAGEVYYLQLGSCRSRMSSLIAILCCLSATLYSTAAQVGGELTRYYNSSLIIKKEYQNQTSFMVTRYSTYAYSCISALMYGRLMIQTRK